jgi:hypothetical protein
MSILMMRSIVFIAVLRRMAQVVLIVQRENTFMVLETESVSTAGLMGLAEAVHTVNREFTRGEEYSLAKEIIELRIRRKLTQKPTCTSKTKHSSR